MDERTPPSVDDAPKRVVDAAVRRLVEAGVPAQALGVLEPRRRVLGLFPRAERVRVVGHGWRLGVLVVTREGEVLVDATTTRSKRPARVGYSAESARARDALRHAAFRGGTADGATIHVGGERIDMERGHASGEPLPGSGSIALRDGHVVVRWAPSAPLAAATPLGRYLDERVELLIAPPEPA